MNTKINVKLVINHKSILAKDDGTCPFLELPEWVGEEFDAIVSHAVTLSYALFNECLLTHGFVRYHGFIRETNLDQKEYTLCFTLVDSLGVAVKTPYLLLPKNK